MRRRNKYVSTFWGGPKPPQKEVFQTIYFGALPCLKNFCRGAAKSQTVETKTDGKKYLSFLSHAAFHAEPVHSVGFASSRLRSLRLTRARWILTCPSALCRAALS